MNNHPEHTAPGTIPATRVQVRCLDEQGSPADALQARELLRSILYDLEFVRADVAAARNCPALAERSLETAEKRLERTACQAMREYQRLDGERCPYVMAWPGGTPEEWTGPRNWHENDCPTCERPATGPAAAALTATVGSCNRCWESDLEQERARA